MKKKFFIFKKKKNDSLNHIAKDLNAAITDLEIKNAMLNSILNSMSGGVLVIDKDNKIILMNDAIKDIVDLDASFDYTGSNFSGLIRNIGVQNMVFMALKENKKTCFEIKSLFQKDQFIKINIVPVNSGVMIYMEDITEVKRLEQIRTEFASNVTHELKTPLTSIKGFIETLKSGAVNDPVTTGKFLEIIDIEADRLTDLINDILDLSEIEDAGKNPNFLNDIANSVNSNHDTDFNFVLDDVLEILQKKIIEKNIEIYRDISNSLKLPMESNRLKQLLMNLIDNAIKYNNQNGKIWITAFTRSNMTVMKIKDTGIGISTAHLSRIFERFYRVDKGRSRNMGGTGLGLSIVKHLVQLYDGDISVISNTSDENSGTEFKIVFYHTT